MLFYILASDNFKVNHIVLDGKNKLIEGSEKLINTNL